MRIALIAPNYFPPESGNGVTVRRLERSLAALGVEVQVFPTDCLPPETLLASLQRFGPQLLHAFHGYSGGKIAHALCETLGTPYLVTLTGSDVYEALADHRSLEMHPFLRGAARLVAFHGSVKQRLAHHMPTLLERTVVIPQGVSAPDVFPEETAGKEFIFLLPAGLRPVKNVLFPLKPLARLYRKYPEIRLHLAGPVRETEYAAQVMAALEEYPFAHYLGVVRHNHMDELYRRCQVVLNTSLFEGGMANSVLEALAQGRPLLVSDVEGNRSIVKDGVTGLIYHDEEEFVHKGERLITDAHLRSKLARMGHAFVQEKFAPEQEGAAYLELYREVVAEGPCAPGEGHMGEARHL